MDSLDGEWSAAKALSALKMEEALANNMTPAQIAKKLLNENLPIAVMAICHIAQFSDSEPIRFNAAKFIVERTMGPSERVTPEDAGHRFAWDDIYDKVTTDAENYANGN